MKNSSEGLKDLQQSAANKKNEKESLLLETQEQSLKEYHNALAKLFKKEANSIKTSIQSRSRLLEYKLLALIVLASIIGGMTAMHFIQKSRYHLVPKNWIYDKTENGNRYFIEPNKEN